MFITNGIPATLIKYNRPTEDADYTGVWDDEYTTEENIVVCPYNADATIQFGTYSVPGAEGFFILKNCVDVKEGDQIVIGDKTMTILKVKDNWIWNKIVNYTVAVDYRSAR